METAEENMSVRNQRITVGVLFVAVVASVAALMRATMGEPKGGKPRPLPPCAGNGDFSLTARDDKPSLSALL